MTAITRVVSSRKFFTYWFGLGVPPFLIGAVAIAFVHGLWLGLATTAVILAWLVETFRTTCSRCPFFGTGRCGLPGLIAPLLFTRRSGSVSSRRIRLHLAADLGMMAIVNAIYGLEPIFLPAVLLWSLVALMTVYGPKRFHGLLFQLKTEAKGLPIIEFPSRSAPTSSVPPRASQGSRRS
ncbi:hypothetical protein [Tautonia rosea]|uniref:hypothetical protein n=1 Tax=Tautonia rosea TaxID=2728037 RepID=UPI00147406F4|nr:hypothetical protein [Tautonia rosea]